MGMVSLYGSGAAPAAPKGSLDVMQAAVVETPAPDARVEAESEAAASPAPNGPAVQVRSPAGEIALYPSAALLREAILAGSAPRGWEARCVPAECKEPDKIAWTTVEKLAGGNAELRGLYRPVWDVAMKFAFRGALIGGALKLADTAILMFNINPKAGWVFLLVAGSLIFAQKMPFAPIIAFAVAFTNFPKANMFLFATGAAMAGGMFGSLVGLIWGTLAGRSRLKDAQVAPDATPEGNRPLWLGVWLPAACLLVSVPLYIWYSMQAFG